MHFLDIYSHVKMGSRPQHILLPHTVALSSISKASHCTSHHKMTIKITNRWYCTPFWLARFSPNVSPLCWREYGRVGNLLHILWHCPGLTSFWSQVFYLLATCTSILLKPQPALALLSINIDQCLSSHRPVVTHILVAARLIIPRKGKTNVSPNISDVVNMVNPNHTFKSLLAINTYKLIEFSQLWSIWIYR